MRSDKLLKLVVPVFATLVLVGCHAHGVKDEEMNAAMTSMAEKVERAHQLAQQARSEASRASGEAQAAQDTADQALACCRRNSEQMDRMFEKAMMK